MRTYESSLTVYSDGLSEAQVRLQLSTEETAEAARGATSFRETSASGFILAGLHLEDFQ